MKKEEGTGVSRDFSVDAALTRDPFWNEGFGAQESERDWTSMATQGIPLGTGQGKGIAVATVDRGSESGTVMAPASSHR